MSRIAIIGTGVSGLTAAWHLHRDHELTLYEANDYIGGHTATMDVSHEGQHYAIDTGFIVFNDWTYPNFISLLEQVGAKWQFSDMSFSLSCERSGLEYNGTSLNSLFAQRRNIIKVSFLCMIRDIFRFNRGCKILLRAPETGITLGAYLHREGFTSSFAEYYILPMGRAIWSATASAILNFPAKFFVDFFNRHGFLNITNRPVWRTIQGGSREYVRHLIAPFKERIRLSSPVQTVIRDPGGVRIRSKGEESSYDYVFFACHSNQALNLLNSPSVAEREILGCFPYQENEAILHTDTRMLPRTRLARAAWNYHLLESKQERVALTYDMSLLQSLGAGTKFMVTLNRGTDIDQAKILGRYVYHHPVYTPVAVTAQIRRTEISGSQRSFYCGAYWRYGFHEDGVVSALWALQDFARLTGSVIPDILHTKPLTR